MTRLKTLLATAALTASAVAGAPAIANATANLITNGSFETPLVSTFAPGATYAYWGTLKDSWDYSGAAGDGAVQISATLATPWYGSTPPTGYDGAQYAGVQGLGTLTQTFTVSSAELAGAHTLTWVDAGRPALGCCSGDETYDVVLNGNLVGTFSTASGTNFTGETLDLSSLLTLGTNTLEFEGTTSADETAFIDNVDLSAAATAPEPAAWALMLVGFGGLGAIMRRKKNLNDIRA